VKCDDLIVAAAVG